MTPPPELQLSPPEHGRLLVDCVLLLLVILQSIALLTANVLSNNSFSDHDASGQRYLSTHHMLGSVYLFVRMLSTLQSP